MHEQLIKNEVLRYRGLMVYWLFVIFPVLAVTERSRTLWVEGLIFLTAATVVAIQFMNSRECFARLLPMSGTDFKVLRYGVLAMVLVLFHICQQAFMSHYPYDFYSGFFWFLAWASAVPLLIWLYTTTRSWVVSLCFAYMPALGFIIF